MDQCAVAFASPRSTTLLWLQFEQATVGKLRQIERLRMNRCPSRSSAKVRSSRFADSASLIASKPLAAQHSGVVSTTQVEAPSSYWYVCAQKQPRSVFRKKKVKASSGLVEPSHTNLLRVS